MLTRHWFQEVIDSLLGDIKYAAAAVTMIVIYCSLFVGSFSPLHCRLVVALTGVTCVLLACMSGFGICLIYNWKMTELSNMVPVLMLGIGVDDMFVVCNSLDQ